MGSRQSAEGERARLPALSRRAVLVGTSAAAASPSAAAATPTGVVRPAGQAARLYRRWVCLDREVERLLLRWGDIEGWLFDTHNWHRLSEAEQAALPEGQALRDVDAQLKRLCAERDGLLDELPRHGARTLDAIAARLAVVERLLYREDHPEAYDMIVGSRRDLAALTTRAPIREALGHERP
ncbi:MAG: helicase [Phenylobacterium sp.]|uniref:helicase n=1 Tax=Phenylobacterium sp. TaxID=1871053 RepID=UPI001A307AFD|nr:helicase [Phenylobacterium sp.]MBJ7411258.1 helicase [Phenylobacterium sp.]